MDIDVNAVQIFNYDNEQEMLFSILSQFVSLSFCVIDKLFMLCPLQVVSQFRDARTDRVGVFIVVLI